MQRTNEGQRQDAEKEVKAISFDFGEKDRTVAVIYYYDGTIDFQEIYERIIPIIKKRKKRKKGFDRDPTIYVASLEGGEPSD